MRRTFIVEAINSLTMEFEKRARVKSDLFQKAKRSYDSGDYPSAERAYRELLNLEGRNADAWRGLALVYLGVGRIEEALEAIIRALRADSAGASQHFVFGLVLKSVHDPAHAVCSYQSVTGIASDRSRQMDPIEIECRHVIADKPEYASYLKLGSVLMARHKIDEAIAVYELALGLMPESSEVLRNLGFAYELKQDRAKASLYLGYMFLFSERYQDALAHFQEFSKHDKGDIDFYVALSECYLQLSQYDDAMKVYREATSLYRQADKLALQVATKLKQVGHASEAIAIAEHALSISPQNLQLRYRYHLALPAVYESEEEIEFYRHRFARGLDMLINETPLRTIDDRKKALEAISQSTNFYLAYQGHNDVELQSKYGELVHQIMVSNYPQWATPRQMPAPDGGRIRIGYVSAYFHHHSVGNMYLGWLRYRDRSQFEVYCYYLGQRPDHVTYQYRLEADHFRDLSSGIESACLQILADHLHILVFLDIGMFPPATQIGALRLAPVQCATWGHAITSGLPTMDYYLSGDAMEPPDGQAHYSETLIRLPNYGLAYEKVDVPTQRKTREDFGIRNDAVVYLSCQSLFKYLPRYDYIFPEIARRVGKAVFVFIARIDPHSVDRFRERLRRAFGKAGLDYRNYCVLLPGQDSIDYLNLFLISDVFLDTLWWSGCNTTLEAIACGLPVVTMPGVLMRSRHSYAFLKIMELTETIANDEKEYVEIAANLGLDRDSRSRLSEKMVERHPRLYEDKSCVSSLEKFYRQVVREHDSLPTIF